MPVIISDFEVVNDAPVPPPATPNPNAEANPRQQDKPDFEDVLRHWHERAERVRAH
jgi:hypothetical protein